MQEIEGDNHDYTTISEIHAPGRELAVEVTSDVQAKVEPELLRCYIDDERLSNE